MIEIVIGIIKASIELFVEMAPYLIFGYFFAGILHIFFNTGFVSRQLGSRDLMSVIKASLFGIPLPLCSCSVIPSAMSLKKEGASKGSVLSFLISTPTTGVDSIFATYALLGWFFTLYRIIASFITGVFAGILSNIFNKEDMTERVVKEEHCKLCKKEYEHKHSLKEKISSVFSYAFGTLLKDTGPAILLGVLIGGGITFFMPDGFIEQYLGSGILPMIIMLIVGVPMYVCATASIPIAAALLAKGISPGAALVFLIAGPATNIVTMMVISKNMGKRSLFIYLASIIIGSIIMGLLMNLTYDSFSNKAFFGMVGNHKQFIPLMIQKASGLILFVLIAVKMIKYKLFSSKKEVMH